MNPSIHAFVNYLKFEKRYSEHTVDSYNNDLAQFSIFIEKAFGSMAVADISSSLIRSWLASLKEGECSARTINRKISSLKSFFKFLMRDGIVSTSPLTAIISPRPGKRLPVYVDLKDTETLFRHVEFPNDFEGKTDRLIMRILYNTGIRLSELIKLRDSQIDLSERTIKVFGKGKKERIIPVSPALAGEILDYYALKRTMGLSNDQNTLLVRQNGNALYPKFVYLVVKKYLGMVTTIDKKSPHVLRHSFATHLTNEGADLNSVKELLGHSSLAATQVYTHNSIENLKDIYRKSHPKA